MGHRMEKYLAHKLYSVDINTMTHNKRGGSKLNIKGHNFFES